MRLQDNIASKNANGCIIKVCGMHQPDNIEQIEAAGIDWMGFIFYPRSPRYVDAVPAYLPEKAKRVGVFVDADEAFIAEKVETFRLDYLQLHGHEDATVCSRLEQKGYKVIKAFAIATAEDFTLTAPFESHCSYFLFDTRTPQQYGGSGMSFDWALLEAYEGHTPFLLSGGIGVDHAATLAQLQQSYPLMAGVDLNSRFETTPGVKDAARVKQFIDNMNLKRK